MKRRTLQGAAAGSAGLLLAISLVAMAPWPARIKLFVLCAVGSLVFFCSIGVALRELEFTRPTLLRKLMVPMLAVGGVGLVGAGAAFSRFDPPSELLILCISTVVISIAVSFTVAKWFQRRLDRRT